MKNIWKLGLLLIWLTSCTPKPEEYYMKIIKIGPRVFDTTKVVIDSLVQGNKLSLKYKTSFNTFSYIIDKLNKKKSQLLLPTYGAESFHFEKEYSIIIDKKEYKIFHFSTFNGTIDGGSEHYWNEKLGVFFTRGRSWPYFFILESTNKKKNKIIWSIIKQVYPNMNNWIDDINLLEKEELTTSRKKAATNKT